MKARTDDIERVLNAEVASKRLTLRQGRTLFLIWRAFRRTAR